MKVGEIYTQAGRIFIIIELTNETSAIIKVVKPPYDRILNEYEAVLDDKVLRTWTQITTGEAYEMGAAIILTPSEIVRHRCGK